MNMKAGWLSDARKIPDEVMNYLRRIAVRAVEEKDYSPELIADILGISRSSIYDWLQWYRDGGEATLDTQSASGVSPVITPVMDGWLNETVLHSTPIDHGYDTLLWTRSILAVLLKKHFGICVSEATVGLHLHQMKLSCQTPCYQALQQDPKKVDAFLDVNSLKFKELLKKWGRILPLRTRGV
jgi:transposase